MGWLFYDSIYFKPNGQVDRKQELDKMFNGNWELVRSAMVGTTYYAAVRCKRTGVVEASVILTSSYKKGGHNFGYKDMTENMGPNEAQCPKCILNLLTPTEHEYAKEWRERCWQYHKDAKSPLAFKNLPLGAKVVWTIPHERFTGGKKGEKLVLEKHKDGRRSRARWVCWDKYFTVNPKYVNAADIKLIGQ